MADTALMSQGEFLAVLPAYVNGTASPAQQAQVKRLLAADSQARASLAWHEALAEKVIADVESTRGNIGWEQLQAKVRSEKLAQRATTQPAHGSWVAWLQQWMPHRWLSGPALSGVCAALVAVVVGQGLFQATSQDDREYSQVRGANESSLSGQAPVGSKFIKLNFKDRITERDMRLMLVRSGAVIVSGPGQLGDYTVAVPAADLPSALREFKDSSLTESVQETQAPTVVSSIDTTGSAPGAMGQKSSIKGP